MSEVGEQADLYVFPARITTEDFDSSSSGTVDKDEQVGEKDDMDAKNSASA